MKNSKKIQKITFSTILVSALMGCSLFQTPQETPKIHNIYDVLKLECKERTLVNDYSYVAKGMNESMLSCCLESVKHMEKYNYKEPKHDEQDKPSCQDKKELMQFKCPGTLAWCE